MNKKIGKGISTIKSANTWKNVGKSALGAIAGSTAAMLGNKLAGSNQTIGYALGAAASGVVSIGCFAFNQEQAGYGAATVTATQAVNTALSAVTGKSIAQLSA
jgi:hypothetical protein